MNHGALMFAALLLLLLCCCSAAALLLLCCCSAAALLLLCCCSAAALLLLCCCSAAVLQVCVYCSLLPLQESGVQLPAAVAKFMAAVSGQAVVKAGTTQVCPHSSVKSNSVEKAAQAACRLPAFMSLLRHPCKCTGASACSLLPLVAHDLRRSTVWLSYRIGQMTWCRCCHLPSGACS
jgi:hypothetical protein